MKIAIIPVGYMDGFSLVNDRCSYSFKYNLRSVLLGIKDLFRKNKYKVTINDKDYYVIGRIGMCHTIIDTNDDNIELCDKVEFKDLNVIHINSNIRREYV